MNDIRPWTRTLTARGMVALLGALSKVNPAMPPFVGNQAEKEALAAYLAEVIGDRKDLAQAAVGLTALDTEIPAFDPQKDAYVLLAWPDLGMHMVVESQGAFTLRTPSMELNAQLVKRGESPSKITDSVELTFAVEGGATAGAMKVLEGRDWFQATLSVSPRKADGTLNPYPLATVEARDAATKALLGRTRAVLPVSDEVDCASCHGGGTIKGDIGGETGLNILRIHDRLNRTRLTAQALSASKGGGTPVQCTGCHGDPLTGKEGRGDLLSVSAALHGFHANTLKGQGAEACARCHPSRADGGTRFQRGLHAQMGLDCVACHGALEDHALGLLKREAETGKRGARRLLSQITPQGMDKQAIPPRTAWLQTPDCLACHKDFGAPDPSRAFGNWTKGAAERFRSRLDEAGALSCPACHGPQHALYPSVNPYGKDRDVIQPLQYQKLPRPLGANGNCPVCHKVKKDGDAHHPNLLRKGG